MAIELQRLSVKLYLEDESKISADAAFRIFNRWISETTDEVLIDVADYTHIPKGPQTLLVGHEADYALDNTDGEMGLRYGRKRPMTGDRQQRLRDAIASALSACQRLESAEEAAGARFDGGRLLLSVVDRLHAPNTEDSLTALRDDLLAVLSRMYGDAGVEVTRNDDPRECLTLQIRATGTFRVADMAAALAA